jgi:hypothetical protein
MEQRKNNSEVVSAGILQPDGAETEAATLESAGSALAACDAGFRFAVGRNLLAHLCEGRSIPR